MHPLAEELNAIYEQLERVHSKLLEKLERPYVPGGKGFGTNTEGLASQNTSEALNSIQNALEILTSA